MEAFLSSRIPNFIPEYTVVQSAFLGQECGTDSWLLVGLELVADLYREGIRSKRRLARVPSIRSAELRMTCPQRLHLVDRRVRVDEEKKRNTHRVRQVLPGQIYPWSQQQDQP